MPPAIQFRTPAQETDLRTFGVYSILNTITGRRYIGSTTSAFRERWVGHRRDLRNGEHDNAPLQAAWNYHGALAFLWLIEEIVPDRAAVLAAEQRHLNQYQTTWRTSLYNVCQTAGSTLGMRHSAEQLLAKCKAWVFVAPDDTIHHVVNMRAFCREHGLPQSHMINIAHGRGGAGQYKGWLCFRPDDFSLAVLKERRTALARPVYRLIDPDGLECVVVNLARFCRERGLDAASLFNTRIGRKGRQQHKGWRMLP
ncbi:MAG: GIY-YIG nuclease family protein [Dehalococcoidia bacterium]